jgi:hypothetical protein
MLVSILRHIKKNIREVLYSGEVDQMVMHVLFVAHENRRNSVIDFIV